MAAATAVETENIHSKKADMQRHLSQLLAGVESSDKYSLSKKAKIEELVHKTRMDLEKIKEPVAPTHAAPSVAEKKAHISKTLSKLLADVEGSSKYSDEKKTKVEELVHKMRMDLKNVGEKAVAPVHHAAPVSHVASTEEKKAHISKTLSKLLADVEGSSKYSDEKKTKVEELVHKMRMDLKKVGQTHTAPVPHAAPVEAKSTKKAHINKVLSKLLGDVERSPKYSDAKKEKIESLIHKMRKDVQRA
jgi:hypothetical protein